MPTTPGSCFALSLPNSYQHWIAVNRRSQKAVCSSLYSHLQREVARLAVNFAELLIAALSICSFGTPSTKKCHTRLHI
jgi:hypothetical protein